MYNDFSSFDLTSNPYFMPQESGQDTYSVGAGDGSDWMDWSLLPEEVRSQFMSPRGIDQGPYRGQETYRDSNFSLSGLQDYLKSSGSTLQERNRGGTGYKNMGQFDRGLFSASGSPIGNIQTGDYGNDMSELGFALGSMFLNPAGGVVAGGAAGGIGGSLASNPGTAAAINAGASGAGAAYGSGAEGNDVLKAGASGAASAYMPNIAGYAGISDPNLQGAVNGGIRGATLASINGGDARTAALQGALPSLASYTADSVTPYFQGLDDMQGTIGGNMADADGETSATLGGIASTAQVNADDQRKQALADTSGFQMPELNSFFSRLIPNSPQQFGDLAQGLMGMYAGYRQRRDAKKLAGSFGSNRGAYEQQLQKDLMRRDARAGRRSNYEGRATELQAKLAELDSRNAPAQMQLQQQQMGGLLQMLQSGLRYGGKSGAFGDSYNPNVPTAPASTMLPSTWSQPQPADYSLGNLNLGGMPKRRGLLGGGG